MTPIYHGSGTIISPDGMILTNCHVADPISMGYPSDLNPDALLIELVINEDKPPVPSYIARVVASDPTLDLAVLRLETTLDGKQVNTNGLNLPYVQLGDSKAVRFGDPIYIFGFPSIGGDTITYSAGGVAGFDAENPVGDRAWIKTDATIAGGNSGGLAANDQGQIIGVPSQIGTGSATEISDCRRIQDTNDDGRIDSQDSCIPTGGFINGIRPIDWAKPLINAANTGQAYVSPYGGGSAGGSAGSGGERMILNGWAVDTDTNGCIVPPKLQSFPSGAKQISTSLNYSGMSDREKVEFTWYLDGRETAADNFQWELGASGDCYGFYLENGGDALPDGTYRLEVFAGGRSILQAQTRVGGSAAVNGVTMQGTVTDAYSSKPIADVTVVVLKPGVDSTQWLRNPVDADVYSLATTDGQGYYKIPDTLERGKVYGVVAGNTSAGYTTAHGDVEITLDDPDVVELPIQLSK
ncbi:MAG: hypothetical protein HGA53_06765, partial [Anaerolineaceae bacterium]|nr:hypothetical protein [Anaerolineaceae bacterium]